MRGMLNMLETSELVGEILRKFISKGAFREIDVNTDAHIGKYTFEFYDGLRSYALELNKSYVKYYIRNGLAIDEWTLNLDTRSTNYKFYVDNEIVEAESDVEFPLLDSGSDSGSDVDCS